MMHINTAPSVLGEAVADAAQGLIRFSTPGWLWTAFLVGVAVLLLLDLLVVHREAHKIRMREAVAASAFWIALGLLFALPVGGVLGGAAAMQYLTGYVIEKSLSVDNVFVWAVVFQTLSIPSRYQHRVLFWGIFGALILRAIFILSGVALLERMGWLLFVFGGILIATACRIATHEPSDVHPERNLLLKLVRRYVPVTADFHGQNLFVRVSGRWFATPLLVVLVLVEGTDVVFAVDSVPAILAVSRDPFVVFSSNAMAILGLRALYFLLAGAQAKLVHLNKGLAVILAFVGCKMIASRWFHVPTTLSLAVILGVLAITVLASLYSSARNAEGKR